MKEMRNAECGMRNPCQRDLAGKPAAGSPKGETSRSERGNVGARGAREPSSRAGFFHSEIRNRKSEIWKAVRGSYYDPRTRKIYLDRNAPPYVAVHEWAHARQHRTQSIPYRLWEVTCALPWVRRATRLLVEWEADAIARAEMRRCKIWDEASEEISRMVLWNYARWLPVP